VPARTFVGDVKVKVWDHTWLLQDTKFTGPDIRRTVDADARTNKLPVPVVAAGVTVREMTPQERAERCPL
jgi:hypothetical protein